MGIAKNRAERIGSTVVQIGSTKLEPNADNDIEVKDTSNNRKKVIASELRVGTGNDIVIIKRDASTGKAKFETSSDGGGSSTEQSLGGTTVYANPGLLPAGSSGDMAFITSNNNLMVHNGSGWYKVATVTNASPTISSAGNASYTFATDGTPVSIEITASDPEGIALQYKWQITSGSLGSTATVTSSATSGGTYSAIAENTLTNNKYFKITPSTNSDHAGSFAITFSASDGINTANSSASSFTLGFDVGASVYFDGTNDYLLTNTSSDLVIGSNDFTADCWIYPTTFAGVQGVIDRRRNGDPAAYDWTTYLNTDNTLNFYANGGTRITSSALSTNRWYHTAVVKKSGTTTLYVDGKSQGTYSDSNTYPSNQMTFGAYGPSLASLWYDGYASNLRMVVGSDVYTPSTTASGLDLDNQNTTLSSHAGFDFGTDDFTVEFFFKWDSNSGYQTLIDHNYSSAGGFTLQSNSGTYKWGLWGDVSKQYESTNATQDVWHHYAIVRNGNTVKMYRDGVETLSKSHSGSVGSTNSTTFGHGTYSVNGKISNFRVVIGTALYTSAGFTIPSSSLTAISGTSLLLFQENSGSTLSDGSTNSYTVNIGGNSGNILTSDGPFPATFTVPTSPFDNDSNTLLLTCQNNTGSITDASSSNHVITANGNTAANSDHPF